MSRTHATTRAVRAGIATDTQFGAVIPPLVLSSNFTFEAFGRRRRYDYTRSGNPTRDLLAQAISGLEGGAGAVITATGMAAVTLVLQWVCPGQRVVAPHDAYGGTLRLLKALSERGWFELVIADLTDPESLQGTLERKPTLVWVETPSNPLLRITDLKRVCRLAHAVGALVAVDNTFLTPLLQRPIELGADFVVHSTTKYLNGHSDVVGGAVVARDAALLAQLSWWSNCLGLSGAPFDAHLTLRGLRTLPARMRVHLENAARVVETLGASEVVEHVYYPGLAQHPGHELARRQQYGFGAMVSFDLGPRADAVERFLDGLSCFTLAESLGGVESLIAHPATMTHANLDAASRQRAGIGTRLLRLSVGIEHADDLVEDLQRGLERVARRCRRTTVRSGSRRAGVRRAQEVASDA